jgi:hypothetical protein
MRETPDDTGIPFSAGRTAGIAASPASRLRRRMRELQAGGRDVIVLSDLRALCFR